MKDILKEEINKIGIQLDDEQMNQFLKYYDLLTEWNRFMNLTAITDYKEVIQKHFVDSLSIIKAIDIEYLQEDKHLIDIGTGAGFPGIPIKIVFPKLKITLLDSLNKRIKFLNEVIGGLKLKDIEAIHGRAEDYARHEKYREQYDVCVSRAVANLSSLSEYCLPYVKVGGRFVSYKSGDIGEEVNDASKAIALLGGKKERIEKFQLPDTDIQRSFVVIRKTKNTQKRYPRKAGMPTKEPLK